MSLVETPRDNRLRVMPWLLIPVAVVLAMLCCSGACVLLLIAPDQMAAFSPFNWW
jgi:hypothetical protein